MQGVPERKNEKLTGKQIFLLMIQIKRYIYISFINLLSCFYYDFTSYSLHVLHSSLEESPVGVLTLTKHLIRNNVYQGFP